MYYKKKNPKKNTFASFLELLLMIAQFQFFIYIPSIFYWFIMCGDEKPNNLCILSLIHEF